MKLQHSKKPHHEHVIDITKRSFIINLCFGFGKLGFGLYYTSYWLIVMAGYYLVLSVAKAHILHSTHMLYKTVNDEQSTSLRIYRRSGGFVMLLGVSYFICCYEMMDLSQTITYPYYLLYGVVAYAFYKIISAIYGLLQARRQNMLMVTILKVFHVCEGCVGIVSAQCALLTMQSSLEASSSSAMLGMGVSICFLFIGLKMLCRKQQKI